MITLVTPSTWRDLQADVARILREGGFAVDVERTLNIARGRVEVDVYATETIDNRTYTTLVECKNWGGRVPQSVIHSFRSVVADAGANVGYIVSRAGFQAGAFSAAELTNLRLVTWEEFQVAFEATWLDRFFVPTITEDLDPLFTYTEPLLPRWYVDLDAGGQQRYLALRDTHGPLGVLLFMAFASYGRLFGREMPIPPLRGQVPDGGIPADVLDAPAYRELLEASLRHGRQAIAEFRALRPANASD